MQTFDSINNNIKIVRGDYLPIDITISNTDGSVYNMFDYEYLIFTVREDGYSDKILIQKTLPEKTTGIELFAEDTEDLEYGTYRYDVELVFSDRQRFTIINNKLFRVFEEIGW